jgi:hypothetical protein
VSHPLYGLRRQNRQSPHHAAEISLKTSLREPLTAFLVNPIGETDCDPCNRVPSDPRAYLQDELTRLPAMPAGQLGDLLPDHWQVERQARAAAPAARAIKVVTPFAESAS